MKLHTARRARRRRACIARAAQPAHRQGARRARARSRSASSCRCRAASRAQRRADRQRRPARRRSRPAARLGGYTIDIPTSRTTPSTASTTRSRAPRTCQTLVDDDQRRRHGRPVQLERRPGRDPGQQRGRPAPVQPGQHQRRPDQAGVGALDSARQPDQDRLRPRRHHGRQPGPGGAEYASTTSASRSRATSSMTPRRSARASPTASGSDVQKLGGTIVKRDGAPPRTPRTTRAHHRRQGRQPRRRLLRRRHPDRPRPAPQADVAGRAWRHPVRRPGRHHRRHRRRPGLVPQRRRRRRRTNSYGTVAAVHDIPGRLTHFAGDYKAKFGSTRGAYSAPGLRLRAGHPRGPRSGPAGNADATMKALREGVRVDIVDATTSTTRSLGTTVTFDANGDTSQTSSRSTSPTPPPTARATGSSCSSRTSPPSKSDERTRPGVQRIPGLLTPPIVGDQHRRSTVTATTRPGDPRRDGDRHATCGAVLGLP